LGSIRRFIPPFLLLVLATRPAVLPAQQIGPPSSGGLAAVERALARLDQNKRVLLIAAHPDDEDTELLTLLSRGMGVDAAYLSLSRGEGGQNLIGPELGEQLGLIRTGELLAARSVDRARQFFTRAFDFGFSKSLEETLRFWPRDTILADVLSVIRQFRPQIIVTTFRGTPRDGHGQHQLSAVIARQAFELLRDSAWGPVKLYRSARFDSSANALGIPNAALDPLDGRSYLQIAMASRSLHRSQDMGQLQRLGASTVRLELTGTAERRLTRAVGQEDPLFAGVDTTVEGVTDRYLALVDSARRVVHPRNLPALVPVLAAAWEELRRGMPRARMAKQALLTEAIAAAAGVVVDATVNDGRIAPGEGVRLAATIWNTGPYPVSREEIRLFTGRTGWRVLPIGTTAQLDGGPAFFASGPVPVAEYVLEVPSDAEPTTLYFLESPRAAGLYRWPFDGRPGPMGSPINAPLIGVTFHLKVAGVDVFLTREAVHRYNDQALGEIRKPVVVVPTVSVSLTPDALVWSAGVPSRAFQVELVNGRRDTVSGFVRLVTPGGWPAVAPHAFTLAGEEARRAVTFQVSAPPGVRPGSYTIRAVADVQGWGEQSRASVTIDYPHIRPMTWVKDAVSRVEAATIALPRLHLVGYVRGASDRVPEALESVGVPLALLSPDHLERGDLSAYDVIVIGSRAYETDPALVANNPRLLEWVRGGGRLIVQYQQYQFVSGRFAPFPLTMGRPHDRVTDEAAPVRSLAEGHALFRVPNAIADWDWEGWVQERGLYFAHEWDAAYQPLLELGDNGERLRGGLLVARHGRGLYVYTGLAFFRQLPAGVPGAYRLFLNLLALRPDDVP
jgi:LmbE family N-acetylglucosaminyl deacetylase